MVTQSDKLLPVAETFTACSLPTGKRACVLTDGGGHGTIAIDFLVDANVEIAELKPATKDALSNILPQMASLNNPIDVAGGSDENPEIFAQCLDIIMSDSGVDMVLIVGLFGGYGIRFSDTLIEVETNAGSRIGQIAKTHKKPPILQSVYSEENTAPLKEVRQSGVPVFKSIETAAYCLTQLSNYSEWLRNEHNSSATLDFDSRNKSNGLIIKAQSEKRPVLYEFEALKLLEESGLIIPDIEVMESIENADHIAHKFNGTALALKVCSRDIIHKSDAGCVKLNVSGNDSIRSAYEDIRQSAKQYNSNADIAGIIVTPMANPGVEIIIGVIREPIFGPILMFGLGGIFVEVLKDVAFRSLPLTEQDAKQLLKDIKSQAMLDGVRGNSPVDKPSLINLIMGISELIENNPDITEIDLNPVIVNHDGYQIVDARFAIRPSNQTGATNGQN